MAPSVLCMTEIVLFHHIRGLTAGVMAFADALRDAGHTVHTPDLFDGATFESHAAGQAFVEGVGFDAVRARGVAAVEGLPEKVVYGGFSLGVMPAQQLLQARPGALGGLFYHAFADPTWFGEWPDGTPVQIHSMDADPFFVDEGDIEAARPFVDGRDEAELFLYPGDAHLFTDRSLADYDEAATQLVLDRSLALVERL